MRHLWFLDPQACALEVLALEGEGYRIVATYAGAATVRAESFDAIELNRSLLWLPDNVDR